MHRKIKFGETLKKIFKSQDFDKTKKIIADEAGISTSVLSQYINNKTKPSFESLINLANTLDVSLDYLVFGEDFSDTKIADFGHIYHYIDKNLLDLQAKTDYQTWMLGRVARVLYDKMKKTVEETIAMIPPGSNHSGVLKDSEVLELETYSLETKIASTNLQYDMMDKKTPGRFLEVVAKNLFHRRNYQFILSQRHPKGEEWSEIVANYLRLLRKEVDSAQIVNDLCEFRIARSPLPIGFGIYKLDEVVLMKEKPILFQMIEKYIYQSRVGYVIPTNDQFHANPMMDTEILNLAIDGFEDYWKSGDLVSRKTK
jgi:transcriptional regulator with XRE-family HTH domain